VSEGQASQRFPDFFPDGCPPETAEPTSGRVYRWVKTNPPTSEDFKSHYELGKPRRRNTNPCQYVGLSVYRSVEVAVDRLVSLKERLPNLDFGDHIAEGDLTEDHGKIEQSGRDSEHHTWWPFLGVDHLSLFRVVRNVEGQS